MSKAPLVRLKDYRPSPWLIDKVELCFRLAPQATRVKATLHLRPRGRAFAPLVLQGENLRLVSLALNGRAVAAKDHVVTAHALTLKSPPRGPFKLHIETEIDPAANTELSGLYQSNGIFCTQCEAEGFRRITYFLDRPDVLARYHVRIEARQDLPVLLSNGNPGKRGKLADGWHFAEWSDPHPKPSYLFALVAGKLAQVRSTFTTMTGRKVKLGIYVEPGKENRCAFAMKSLKAAMRWDEKVFKRAYDLGVFNIVAVSDFNMGAMENKGLNIFNDKYILATPDSATDVDFELIEAIIAHEYFHNWTGNRITCRDWFQLCLKEGLTVFRDQEFTSDLRSRAVKRIDDVQDLRARQMPEDFSPLQHPPRPQQYIEINNFYTATVYDKGAEICRMLMNLLGRRRFDKGIQLYFKRHDGEAATIEQFLRCFEDAAKISLKHFARWYTQGGTPEIDVQENYNNKTKTYNVVLEQGVRRLKGQSAKLPLQIPLAMALLDRRGRAVKPAKLPKVFAGKRQTFAIKGLAEKPVLSFNQGFAAPVVVKRDVPQDELLLLLGHDADGFNRWEAGQMLSEHLILAHYHGKDIDAWATDVAIYARTLAQLLANSKLEPAYRAKLLAVPDAEKLVGRLRADVDAFRLHVAISDFRLTLGKALGAVSESLYHALSSNSAYAPDAKQSGRRGLRNAFLGMALAAGEAWAKAAAEAQFVARANFTDEHAAFLSVTLHEAELRPKLLTQYYVRHKADPLLIDKWFAAQARIEDRDAPQRVRALMGHEAFTLKTPNRVYALLRTFIGANFAGFHQASGAGYKLAAGAIITVNDINPQVASRLATGFRSWRQFDAVRRAAAEGAMREILAHPKVSKDVLEIISRTLSG